MSALFARWGAPMTYIGAVLLIGLTLITVLARSPDTKLNTRDSAEDYERTALATIGEEETFAGFGAELGPDAAANYLRAGCASCHGLNGEGGAVGPAIWKQNAEDMLDAIREGARGMPLFSSERLSDEQVEALSNHLNGLREAAQRDSESELIVAPTETPESAATVAPMETPESAATVTPTETPESAATVAPMETPEPAATVAPMETPESAATVAPTETPEPAATVTPTETPTSPPPPGPGSAGVVRVRVEINHEGFDGSPQFLLEVERGQRVELTFVWTDADPENAHRMHLDGYGLQTKLLDGDRREDTMSFVADRVGTFELTCDWRCEGHKNLKGGVVQVSEGGQS